MGQVEYCAAMAQLKPNAKRGSGGEERRELHGTIGKINSVWSLHRGNEVTSQELRLQHRQSVGVS